MARLFILLDSEKLRPLIQGVLCMHTSSSVHVLKGMQPMQINITLIILISGQVFAQQLINGQLLAPSAVNILTPPAVNVLAPPAVNYQLFLP